MPPSGRKIRQDPEPFQEIRLDLHHLGRLGAVVDFAKDGREPPHERRIGIQVKAAAAFLEDRDEPDAGGAPLHAGGIDLERLLQRRKLPGPVDQESQALLHVLDRCILRRERLLFFLRKHPPKYDILPQAKPIILPRRKLFRVLRVFGGRALPSSTPPPDCPVPRVIFHVDMDAFFASIEQRDHPEYRGRPLIVGSPPDRRGVVCAASYEARKFGVRSALPSRTAGKLCPNGIFVSPRMHVYRAESAAIMEILREASSTIEKVSVDEAYLDLTDRVSLAEGEENALLAAVPLARQLKARIAQERGLTASIGVAPNKFLAKLGSDFQKPDGLTMIPERGKVSFLRPLPAGAIHGVGPVTARTLEAHGLLTIGDLQDTELDLNRIVGSFAPRLKSLAFGEDDRPVDPSDERKSISSETTFHEDTQDRPQLRAALKELAADVAQTLEHEAVGALTVQVKVRYSDFHTLTRQLRLEEPLTEAGEIYRLACYLLARDRLVTRPLRLLGISVSTLVAPSAQLRLVL